MWGVGLRPVLWVSDNLAIQGQAGHNYVSNVRGYSGMAALGKEGARVNILESFRKPVMNFILSRPRFGLTSDNHEKIEMRSVWLTAIQMPFVA